MPTTHHAREPDDHPDDLWHLVALTQDGNTAAFGRLYDHTISQVHSYVYWRVLDHQLAEDIAAETYLQALKKISSLKRGTGSPLSWLVTIARTLTATHGRSAPVRRTVLAGDTPCGDVDLPVPEDAGGDPEYQVVANAIARELWACVQRLGPSQRDVLVLRFLNDMTVAEVADVLGKSEATIRVTQHRAVLKLREDVRVARLAA